MADIRLWRHGTAIFVAATLAPVYVGTMTPAAFASATCAHVASDFNGDGFADLATGTPRRFLGDINLAGSIQIDYGSSSGIDPSKARYFDQGSPGMPGAPAPFAEFGETLVSGYFNNDCYADLAVASTQFDPNEFNVIIMYGSSHGLTTTGAGDISVAAGATGYPVALASGDFNHDGSADLAIGTPQVADAGKFEAGVVDIVNGGASGLGGTLTTITQSTPGIPGTSDRYDHFGGALATGDINRDGYDDLIVGTPQETDGTVISAGAIRVVNGSASGLTGVGSVTITQATPGVPGVNEGGDEFGYVLATGDVNHDGYADLVVGIPDESIGRVGAGGGIAYLPGGAAGITGAGTTRFSESTPGIPGDPGSLFRAGSAVAVGDFNNDGFADIAMGISRDLVGTSGIGAGSVVIINGTAAGPTAIGATALSEATRGVPGAAGLDDGFGAALRAADFRGTGRPDLAVGALGSPSCDTGVDCGSVFMMPSVNGSGLTGTGTTLVAQAPNGPGLQDGIGVDITFG